MLKPFDFGELFARVRALARRGPVDARAGARGGRSHARPRHPHGPARRRPRSRSRPRRSSCSRCSCAGPARSCPVTTCSRAPGRSDTRTAPTWSTCTCATCARKSTGRSAPRRSRPCAAPATGLAAPGAAGVTLGAGTGSAVARTRGARRAERDPHVRATLGPVAGLRVAALSLRDRLDDRQAEPAALRARARLLAAPEALERPRQQLVARTLAPSSTHCSSTTPPSLAGGQVDRPFSV